MKVRINDYYGHSEYYRYMPNSVFEALEVGYKNGCIMVEVPESDFMKMIFEKNVNEKPQQQ